MLPVGFEPTISAGERPQTYALDHAATGTGRLVNCDFYFQDKLNIYHVKVEMLSMIAVQILGGGFYNNLNTTCLPLGHIFFIVNNRLNNTKKK